MKPKRLINNLGAISLLILIAAVSCQTKVKLNELSFVERSISTNIENLWAHWPADVTGDGITDLVMINNNGFGGPLGYLEGSIEPGEWKYVMVADTTDGTFGMGDIECADMDFDGDIDIVAGKHPGEWKNDGAPTTLYWYENPGWKPHLIGEAADCVKDINLVDFNKDRKMDVVVMTFVTNTMRIFFQETKDQWNLVKDLSGYGNLHEGMDVGDLNGDGYADVQANGHIFYNPEGDPEKEWTTENLDPKWNSQEGDWSRNGTKTFVKDIDGDGVAEIFVSHSERAGYPVSMYRRSDQGWKETVLRDSIAACHTLQVADFDKDGYYDVLAGSNKGRAVNIGYDTYEVIIFRGNESYDQWEPFTIDENGIYNGRAADYDGDGDIDFFRLHEHGATEIFLMENKVIDAVKE